MKKFLNSVAKVNSSFTICHPSVFILLNNFKSNNCFVTGNINDATNSSSTRSINPAVRLNSYIHFTILILLTTNLPSKPIANESSYNFNFSQVHDGEPVKKHNASGKTAQFPLDSLVNVTSIYSYFHKENFQKFQCHNI